MSMNIDNVINGITRPLIGLFIGVAFAYIFQLAQIAGWIFAVGWLIFLCFLFGAVLLLDRFLDWGFDKLPGLSVKIPSPSIGNTERPHWFVRFGWIFGVLVGFGAVLFLPEEMLKWIIG